MIVLKPNSKTESKKSVSVLVATGIIAIEFNSTKYPTFTLPPYRWRQGKNKITNDYETSIYTSKEANK